MERPALKIVLYLLLVFLCGLAVGVFGHRIVGAAPVAAKAAVKPTPEEFRRQYLNEMRSRLKLTPDQFQKLNEVLDETRSRFHAARASHDQVMKTIREEQTNKIRAMLTEAQRPEYEKLHAEREQRAKANAPSGR